VPFADAIAVQHDAVARLEFGVVRLLDLAGEVDARNERPGADDRRGAGEREAVLVVHGGIVDGDGDVAFHEIGFVEVREFDLRGLFAFRRADGAERPCHFPS
jgi:hypothetical protein